MWIYYSLTFFGLLLLELVYFQWARKNGVIDRPNERSSHFDPTIRGGGIVFPLAVLIWFVYSGFRWPWFVGGLVLVTIISFMDDIKPRTAIVRLIFHSIAIWLLFYQVSFFDWAWWLVLLAWIVSIGALSAFNFMDGINGITGFYALVCLGTCYYIQKYVVTFTNESFIGTLGLSVVVFFLFNFRKRARCFAGDVGSVTIAFAQLFLMMALIQHTGSLLWVLLFLVYGIDAVVTIFHRLIRNENIFKPHRSHLYQHLTNELGYDHRLVAMFYGVAQLLMNIVLIMGFQDQVVLVPIGFSVLYLIFYLYIRHRIVAHILNLNTAN